MEEKKKFIIPEAEIVGFAVEDIITESLLRADEAGWDGEDY